MPDEKQKYNQFTEQYHAKRMDKSQSFWNMIEMRGMAELLRDFVPQRSVLDLACGSGISTKQIAAMNGRVIGADISSSMIELARQENPKIHFEVCDAKKTPFSRSTFDVVSCSLMLHHMKDLHPVFREVYRVLKPQGRFVFSMNHPLSEIKVKRKTEQGIEYLIGPYFHKKSFTWEMVPKMELTTYHHTFQDIVCSLNDTGFAIERLLEPRPKPSDKEINPIGYSKTRDYPSWVLIQARKY